MFIKIKFKKISSKKPARPAKQIAGIPIRSFDPKTIDSDLDSIRTEMIREKLKEFKQKDQKTKAINGKIEIFLFVVVCF